MLTKSLCKNQLGPIKESRTLNLRHGEKNWLCEAFLFLLNQFRVYERCWTDRPNSFLNTQNRCSKWWFLNFPYCTSAFQPWLRGTTFGQRGEFIFQACAYFPPCVHCQQRHQLVHRPSIWSKWKQRQQNKGRDVFAPGILFWHLFWILARPTIICIILRKKKTHPVSLPLDMMMGEMGWKNPGSLLCLILELQRLGQILYCCAIQLLCLTI